MRNGLGLAGGNLFIISAQIADFVFSRVVSIFIRAAKCLSCSSVYREHCLVPILSAPLSSYDVLTEGEGEKDGDAEADAATGEGDLFPISRRIEFGISTPAF